ncbi:MAG: mechanosensitive ion channel [Deltaproteobacteria bacterium]|nr:mechanosensitive ion channel [Deltaproteobacteria bacterium]
MIDSDEEKFFFIIAIWVKNPWSFIVGIIGVVAIGFFAVWSLLSNLLSGIIILITVHFSTGEELEIPSDNIKGKVFDYGLLFTLIEGQDGSIIYVPNNMIFQKIFIVRSSSGKWIKKLLKYVL